MSTGELVLPLRPHARYFWLMLDVPVPGRKDLALVLDSGAPASSVKEGVLHELVSLGRATFLGGRRYVMQELRVGGSSIPDMRVRAGGTTERIDADGIVGLDYLAQFVRVCVQLAPLRLELTLPPTGGTAGA